jgi:hypothetical protein
MSYTRQAQVLPTIESGKTYSADEFAFQIQNLQRTSEGTLASVRGPCRYTTFAWPSRVYSVFHALLDQGMRDVLMVRSGSTMYAQTGWGTNAFTAVHTNLTETASYKYPDQFCEVGGRIVWTNGVDNPLVYDGYITQTTSALVPLGYDRVPNGPTVLGPTAGNDNALQRATNNSGYAHPGDIGTISSDISAIQNGNTEPNDNAIGQMLEGSWNYAVQYEDVFGNLSKISPQTNVRVRQEQTRTKYQTFDPTAVPPITWKDLAANAVTYDDLQRQFWVDNISVGPTGTVARRLLRTTDTLHGSNSLRLLARIPDNETTCFPDETADGLLGAVAQDYLTVPTFKIMCPYNGGLAVANTTANPGIVHFSDPGYPGSFRPDRYIFPDPNGAEVTGISTFNGVLLAFTVHNVYAISESSPGSYVSTPITNGIGCVAPSSICSTSWGEMVWLGRDGFYAYDGKAVTYISEPIERFLRGLEMGKTSRSVAVYNPVKREYVCAITAPGSNAPNAIFCYDGTGWREQQHNRVYHHMCVTRDYRQYVLAASQVGGESNTLVVLDHEVRDDPTTITQFKYTSRWLKVDGSGLTRFNAAVLYVGFLESSSAQVTVNCYRNGRWDEVIANGALTLDADDRTVDLSNLVIGTDKALSSRLYWRRFDMHLRSVDSFAFELVCQPADGEYLNIAAFAFDGVVASERGARIMKG